MLSAWASCLSPVCPMAFDLPISPSPTLAVQCFAVGQLVYNSLDNTGPYRAAPPQSQQQVNRARSWELGTLESTCQQSPRQPRQNQCLSLKHLFPKNHCLSLKHLLPRTPQRLEVQAWLEVQAQLVSSAFLKPNSALIRCQPCLPAHRFRFSPVTQARCAILPLALPELCLWRY